MKPYEEFKDTLTKVCSEELINITMSNLSNFIKMHSLEDTPHTLHHKEV